VQTVFGDLPGLEFEPRYNIPPTQDVCVIRDRRGEGRIADRYRWGLIPFWAKDPAIGNRMINARAETLAEKPSFRQAYSRRRCAVLASGFYEWRKDANGKQPVFVTRSDEQPFALAGLWDRWQAPDGEEIRSCTIVTTEANEFMQPLHDRMPVCLETRQLDAWLDADTLRADLDHIVLGPQRMDLQAWPVSKRVNSPANDSPELVRPLPA
jgi:putative SOS response-associated peptidase YedK